MLWCNRILTLLLSSPSSSSWTLNPRTTMHLHLRETPVNLALVLLRFKNRCKLLLPPKNKEGFITIVPQRTLYVQLQLCTLSELPIKLLLAWFGFICLIYFFSKKRARMFEDNFNFNITCVYI